MEWKRLQWLEHVTKPKKKNFRCQKIIGYVTEKISTQL